MSWHQTDNEKRMYRTERRAERKIKDKRRSIEAVVYGMKWAHSMARLEICPARHPLVKFSLEGVKRKLVHPVSPKEPLSVDKVQAIAEFYVSSNSFATFRFLFILLVGFDGFFCINEINSFCLKDVTINADHMSMLPSEKMTSIRKVIPLILPGLENLRAQFPLLNELLRFCRSLIHHIRLFVILLSPNLVSISTLARACLFLLLEWNSRSTSSPLLMRF